MAIPDWVLATLKVIAVLDTLSVPYVVCGSVASIIHGTLRTTLDADMIADLKPEHVIPFAAALKAEFYVEPDSIKDAIARRTSFNLIYQEILNSCSIFFAYSIVFFVCLKTLSELRKKFEKCINDEEDLLVVNLFKEIILADNGKFLFVSIN